MKDSKIVKLKDGTKWLSITKINYENKNYELLLEINQEENKFKDEIKIMQVYNKEDSLYYDEVKDEKLISKLTKELFPKEKIDINNILND